MLTTAESLLGVLILMPVLIKRIKFVSMAWLWLVAGFVGALLGGSFSEFYHGAWWVPIAYVSSASAVTGFVMMLLVKLKK